MANQAPAQVDEAGGAVTREQSPIYSTAGLIRELRQTEIISSLTQYFRDPGASPDAPEEEIETLAIRHRFAIVLSQDCDLLWDFEARQKDQQGELNGVLIFELEPALEYRTKRKIGRDLWKPITQNKSDRYHFLEAVPKELDLLGRGLPQLLVDFKRCFTLPAEEVYRQFSLGGNPAERRCHLETPYREHLQNRMAYFLQRVVLPLDHRHSAEE